MAPPTPFPTPNPTADGSSALPYEWNDVIFKISLTSATDLSNFILNPIFLAHWTVLRDHMPLTPGTPVNITSLDDKADLRAFTFAIYTVMDSMATSKYDRPTSADQKSWTRIEHVECLVYRAARDFAQPDHLFHLAFERPELKNEPGHKDALSRIRGLAMLAYNLIVNYTLMPQSNVVRKIEAVKPASQPRLSPLPEVRRRWELEHMDVGDMRKTVLDRHRKDEDEREWLIKIFMEDVKDDVGATLVVKEDRDVIVEVEEGAQVGGVKRKFGEGEESEEI
ncbi:hypothetical protein G6514_004596 [Epicoccum nigrum]|nr:hypothetical protein G6514_004596 [Epicoccum nigrum]